MGSSQLQFPWEYLRSASLTTLQSFELSRLNHAANIRKEISALLDQWLDETACALTARWLWEHRNELSAAPAHVKSPPEELALSLDLSCDWAPAAMVKKHR